MSDQDKELRRLQRLSQSLREADAKADAVRAELRAEISAAREAGVTVSAIARAMGVSRQRVQQLLRERRS